MSIPHTILKRIGDAAMNALIDTIERTLNRLEAHPFANVKILAPFTFTTAFTNTRIFHGLGYPLTGYWIVGTSSDVRIARTGAIMGVANGAIDQDPNNYDIFQVTTPATVTLAVF